VQILALTPVSDPQHAGQTNAEHTVKDLLCQLRLVPLVYGASSYSKSTSCASTQATYNGTGQPAVGEVWSSYGLSFTGANCSQTLKSYGASGVGVGPASKFNGTVASVTGVAPENLPGTA